MCSLDGKSGNYYMNTIFRSASENYTNLLPSKCPLREGVLYYTRNASLNINMFKILPIPDNIYQVSFSAWTNERNLRTNLIKAKYKLRLYHTNEPKQKPVKKKKNVI